MLVLREERLILEFLAINGFSASTISSSEVSTLDHEPGVNRLVSRLEHPEKGRPFDDSMECATLVAQCFPELPYTLLSSA